MKDYKPNADKELRRKELEGKVKTITESFEHSPEALSEYISFSARFHQYSHRNKVLIMAQNENASFVASAKKWKDGLPDITGTPLSKDPIYIKKGAKAMYIWHPKKSVEYSVDGVSWYRFERMDEQMKADYISAPETIQKRERLGFVLVPVFDIGQVNCPPEIIPKIYGIGIKDHTAAELFKALESYANGRGITVTVTDLNSITLRGDYNSLYKEIRINSVLEDTQRLSTLIHELGHAELGHGINTLHLPQAQRELEADTFSLMLEELCGVETTDARKNHLQGNYKAFVDLQATLPEDKRTDIDSVFNKVFERFENAKMQISSALTKEAPIQTAPKPGIKK